MGKKIETTVTNNNNKEKQTNDSLPNTLQNLEI